jgi:type I restriction enzyme S subunit
MSDELPQGWATASLNEVAEINPRHPKELDEAMSVTFVPMAGLSETKQEFQFTEERSLGEVRKGFTHFAEGDVLFAKITPCMENGKGAVARGLRNKLGCGTTELHVVRPLGCISPEYIYRFLAQDRIRRAAKENFTGTAGQARVPTRFIAELELPLAPLAEQRRIVAKLETLLGKVDSSQQRLAKISVLLKRFRQSVLAAACSGRLTADWREENVSEDSATLIERIRAKRSARYQDASVRDDLELPDIPESWAWTNLRFLLSPGEAFCYGVVQPGENDSDGALLVRAGDLAAGRVDTRSLRRIPMAIHADYRRSQLLGGEILVTVVGAGIGETAIAQPECAGFNIARAVAKLPVREFNARYVHLWLQTGRAVDWMKGDSREVARPTLNLEQLQTLPVPVAPFPEQQEIVRRVEGLFALADQLELRLAKARGQVEKLTPSLLARAFAGQLVPQDPSDEPAEKLLERIRTAERD